MSGTDAQIKAAYECEGKTPDFIAEDLGFESEAVKAKLMQISKQYRKDCGLESDESDGLNFTDEELKTINKVIYECATSAALPDGTPDFRTKLKAAEYIRDDKKGRKEIVKAVANGPTFNILNMVNEGIQQARLNSQNAMKQLKVVSSS